MSETINQAPSTLAKGQVLPLVLSTPYHADPLSTFASLRSHTGEHVLLESAEVDSRENLKSLMLIDASLRFVCQGNTVTVTPLTENGQVLLQWLQLVLPSTIQQQLKPSGELALTIPAPAADLSEADRLLAVSNIEPLRTVQQQLQAQHEHPLAVFLAGVFAYDLLASFEQLPDVATGANHCPDYQFYLAETLLIIDHQEQRTELLGCLPGGENLDQRHRSLSQRMGELLCRMQFPSATPPSAPVSTTEAALVAQPSAGDFQQIVRNMQKAIAAGDIFQVVPSRQFQLPCYDALASYAQLKAHNPSPYMFYLQTQTFEVFGASPESALKYSAATGQTELYPIAGTRQRARRADGSINSDHDSRIELELRLDKKELAEHLMLVDLARNDLARIAIPGSRYVADLLKVDRYSHVMHLVSRVVATLRPEYDALHAYQACMNMGTLVGAPKIRAAELIRQAEQQRRGSYGGAVGYLTGTGDMDTCIVIRSAFVSQGVATVQAGAGVVADSCPQAEQLETEQKASAVVQAIRLANEGANQ
ncbi:anthranilate synthase component I [Aliidiomarina taiwanensis]|uniref:Anthranilate synthase component 1 n=1 Tax=Aliidiomarina taiwanensis TaxID=946228 RepID=A0A432X1U5_9GAMM|nr:anthranilate synthase component 1 [Aliidiomarina taiwanensis]RUO40536.1 anthranilate synthase component I [Aliidiomarina taiwanensis]